MVQEVKVQSSNFDAESGTGGMNISGVTKSGTSKFHGSAYDYWRNYRFAANDRSNSITLTPKPKSTYQYPGGNVGGPITFGDSYTKNKDRLFFFVAFEAQRQQVDSGSHFTRTYSDAMKNGDFSELLANRGSNLNSVPQLRIPQGFPGAGNPAPNNDMRPYMSATGRYFGSLYPSPNYSDPANLYNYVYSRLEPTDRHDFKARFDWTISGSTKAYVRIANEGETAESSARRVVGTCGRRRAADAEHRREQGQVLRRQHRLGAEPVDDERSDRELQPADAGQPLPESGPAAAGRRRRHVQRHVPAVGRRARIFRQTCCTAGAAAARSATSGQRRTTCSRTTTRCRSATS